MKLEWPRIETKDAWITIGIDRDLNKALDILRSETTQVADGAAQARARSRRRS